MKNVLTLFLFVFVLLTIISSCKEDDSPAITQKQLLTGTRWQLREVRTIKNNNITAIDKLLECERRSTAYFMNDDKYNMVMYNTIDGSCNEKIIEGNYSLNTSGIRKGTLLLTPNEENTKQFYVNQLDPNYLVLQDTLVKVPVDSLTLRLQMFQAVK